MKSHAQVVLLSLLMLVATLPARSETIADLRETIDAMGKEIAALRETIATQQGTTQAVVAENKSLAAKLSDLAQTVSRAQTRIADMQTAMARPDQVDQQQEQRLHNMEQWVASQPVVRIYPPPNLPGAQIVWPRDIQARVALLCGQNNLKAGPPTSLMPTGSGQVAILAIYCFR